MLQKRQYHGTIIKFTGFVEDGKSGRLKTCLSKNNISQHEFL